MSRCPAHTLDPYRQGAGTYYANTHFYKYPLILYLSPPDKSQTQEPTQHNPSQRMYQGFNQRSNVFPLIHIACKQSEINQLQGTLQ